MWHYIIWRVRDVLRAVSANFGAVSCNYELAEWVENRAIGARHVGGDV